MVTIVAVDVAAIVPPTTFVSARNCPAALPPEFTAMEYEPNVADASVEFPLPPNAFVPETT
ncbi:MAG: hypothetical protein DME26_21825 [Verrucomicrobia bacterium]|nr:MAG: hypothetical protein DME26_21825 [Verrucomicrobiota bacterium]